MTLNPDGPAIRRVGPEAADVVVGVVQEAFADRPPLDPPTDALGDSAGSIADHLRGVGGLVAVVDGKPVGAVVLDPDPTRAAVFLRRFGVTPAARGHGVARGLVRAALAWTAELPAVDRVAVLAREELPATIGFWRQQGFAETDRRAPYVELERGLPAWVDVPDADAMRALAGRVAGRLRAGDLLVLSGELGAGKTTFTQGLGAALGVRGAITSPTFVIARVHPSLADGPALIHVDAYRLGGAAELDDLDLDTDLDAAVTVVEWGEGLAEALTESPLEIRIHRATAGDVPADGLDPRRVEIDPVGARWVGVRFG